MNKLQGPKNVEEEGIEDWYKKGVDKLRPVEQWIVDNQVLSESMLRRVPRADLSNGGLALIFQNNEDPYIISLIRGMEDEQLNRLKMFWLSREANWGLMQLNSRWMHDEKYFKHLDERGLIKYEMSRGMRLLAEARAYFVLANKDRKEIFEPQLDKWEFGYEI